MSKLIRMAGLIAALSLIAACAETKTDEVGLFYNQGPFEGESFEKMVEPGSGQVFVWNDQIVKLPINQRDYTFCDDVRTRDNKNGCDAPAIRVTALGGAELAFSGGITFELNTGDEEVVRQFYEEVCRKFDCTDDDGWDEMLRVNMRGPIEDALQEEIRGFSVDALYAGTPAEGENLDEGEALSILSRVSDALADKLKETINDYTGGAFFCGPAYDRSKPKECPDFEFIITEVRPTNDSVVQAFDKNVASRQAVVDARNRAEAERVEAEGLREAQAVLAELYSDGNFIEYQRVLAMLECAKNANCTLVVTSDDTSVNVNTQSNG